MAGVGQGRVPCPRLRGHVALEPRSTRLRWHRRPAAASSHERLPPRHVHASVEHGTRLHGSDTAEGDGATWDRHARGRRCYKTMWPGRPRLGKQNGPSLVFEAVRRKAGPKGRNPLAQPSGLGGRAIGSAHIENPMRPERRRWAALGWRLPSTVEFWLQWLTRPFRPPRPGRTPSPQPVGLG
jgi:hypothetical protein